MSTSPASTYQSVFTPGLLAGQVIMVTGGGSGIGRCTAHELASLGAHVVLVGRNPEKLAKTAQEIVGDGGQASWHSCDIRREDDVKAMVAQVVQQHGRIHGLVNNAGGQYISPLAKTSAKGWQAVIDTNLTGGFLVARECFNQSMNTHGGAVVNIVADMWGSMPGMGHSGAARAGMVSFTETAALEWATTRPRRETCCARCATRCHKAALAPKRKPRLQLCFCCRLQPASSAAPCCVWTVPARKCAWAGNRPRPKLMCKHATPSKPLTAFTAPSHPRFSNEF